MILNRAMLIYLSASQSVCWSVTFLPYWTCCKATKKIYQPMTEQRISEFGGHFNVLRPRTFIYAILAFSMKERREEAEDQFKDRLESDWKIAMEMAETVWEEDEEQEQEVDEVSDKLVEDVMEASEDVLLNMMESNDASLAEAMDAEEFVSLIMTENPNQPSKDEDDEADLQSKHF